MSYPREGSPSTIPATEEAIRSVTYVAFDILKRYGSAEENPDIEHKFPLGKNRHIVVSGYIGDPSLAEEPMDIILVIERSEVKKEGGEKSRVIDTFKFFQTGEVQRETSVNPIRSFLARLKRLREMRKLRRAINMGRLHEKLPWTEERITSLANLIQSEKEEEEVGIKIVTEEEMQELLQTLVTLGND